jgi:hypothetical protein
MQYANADDDIAVLDYVRKLAVGTIKWRKVSIFLFGQNGRSVLVNPKL